MILFQCDGCGRLKVDGETWILGFAAENIGVNSARREISITSSWDRPRAVEPLAVHFCSDRCRASYMNALFGDSQQRLGATRKRIKRVVPGAVVETMVAEKARPKTLRRTTARRKAG